MNAVTILGYDVAGTPFLRHLNSTSLLVHLRVNLEGELERAFLQIAFPGCAIHLHMSGVTKNSIQIAAT